jgi:hypothetical protein
VRLAAWVMIAFAVLSATAVFLPGIQVEVGGVSLGRRASLSLYQAAKERDVARALLGKYQATGGRHVGERAADLLLEHAAKHAKKAHVDDARDAMSTLDDIRDSDLLTAGRALVAVTYGYLALVVLLVALIFAETMRGGYSRKRAIAAVALATVAAATAIAAHIGWREAVWQANDELGADLFGLGIGAYLMPLGACGALAAAIALLVVQVRSGAQRNAERA